MSVRMGRYGAFVQIGTKDDEEKPLFAGLRPGQKMDEITFEEAIDLFKLPRDLGKTPDGEPVAASIGRFGPYVRYGAKFVSIRGDDPYTITLERALELIAEKKLADANRLIRDFPEQGIQVLNGRYGPYVTNKQKNAKIPKDRDPKELTLEDCVALLAAAPERRGRARKKSAAPPGGAAADATPASSAEAKAAKEKAPAAKRRTPRKPKAKKEGAAGSAGPDPTTAS
jgi:DNA topoisomerase-1